MSLDEPQWHGRRQEWPPEEAVIVRHEEEPLLRKRTRIAGVLRARRKLETTRARLDLPVEVERLVEERVAPEPGDDGAVRTLPDGTISIPVYREELVVTKRTVLAERILIRKEAVTELRHVREDLRGERVELETEGDAEVVEHPRE